jgi:PAS domain S-box-containing protein
MGKKVEKDSIDLKEINSQAAGAYNRRLLEASLDPLVTIGPDGKITDVNQATEAVTGVSRDQLIGDDFSNYFTEPEKATRGYQKVLADGLVRDYPLTIRHASGKTTDVLYNATVYRDEKGEVQGVFAAARDVTERKQAEEALHAAGAYNRRLLEASLDPLVTIGPDGKITDVNQATEAVTGVTRGQLVGDDFLNYFTEPEKATLGYQKVLAEGLVRDYPLTIRHASGNTTDVLYNATVYRDEKGEVQGVFAAARDITEQKKAQEEIRRRVEQLATINTLGRDLASTYDLPRIFERLSDAIQTILPGTDGLFISLYDARAGLVSSAYGCVGGEAIDPAALPALYLDELANGALGQVIGTHVPLIANDFPFPLKDPSAIAESRLVKERAQSVLIAPMITQGNLIGVIQVQSNIPNRYSQSDADLLTLPANTAAIAIENARLTDQLRREAAELEVQVQARTAELTSANKELEAFAYSVSHDLRAPLRHIDGFIDLLQKKTKSALDEQSQHYMTIIADSAKQMGTLIDDLLSFSRMGRNEMIRSQINLYDLVRGIILEFKPEIEGRNIEWQIAALPPVSGDRAMLRIAMVNLISNALKFTRPRPQTKIEIGWYNQENLDSTVIFVRDNGVGFDMKYADKLFNVFRRLHRVEEFEGTGIGLANVHRIISRHGGKTWAEGEVGQGATFFFSLPISSIGDNP